MFFRILTSASLFLVIAAMAPLCIGCESMPDMSAPVSPIDLTAARTTAVDPASDDLVIISPSTLVLESQGWGLTVHVAIPYSDVLTSSVRLEGIEPSSTFADDCGNLVCKFLREDIMNLALDLLGPIEEATELPLTLSCMLDGVPFSGEDTITVR